MDHQFYKNKPFTITTSPCLKYENIKIGSNQSLVDIQYVLVMSIKRSKPDCLEVRIDLDTKGGEYITSICAKNGDEDGIEQLEVIEKHANDFKDGSYHKLINHEFQVELL